MLGCKLPISYPSLCLIARINRYMLGCKSNWWGQRPCRLHELIDTCWDVNLHIEKPLYALTSELIDTCWDVNCRQATPGHHQAAELIDTCWDVNPFDWSMSAWNDKRINRYMLGCKWGICYFFCDYRCWINRYMLGCKLIYHRGIYTHPSELIDTCWDVNS